MRMQIVVLENSFVYLGRVRRLKSGRLEITDARCVRRWGTQRGLGQLATDGPLAATVLDPCGRVVVEAHRVHHTIDCDEGKWR